ncbi:MAG: hypothetical protein ABWY06_23275 [Pseudomonas sp.]|uniref:hypothetical protein n=1 Tax=Pseudomonas sp. TaxID=306 RepID=UPI0033913AEC
MRAEQLTGLGLVLWLTIASMAQATPIPAACWALGEPAQLIDVDGSGAVQGAWTVSSTQLNARLQRSTAPVGLLVAGYDLLATQRLCAQVSAANLRHAQLVVGGRERYLAQQGVSAWDWLVVPVDNLATNLLSGGLQGIFIGKGQSVVGKGFEKSTLTDPAEVATLLIERGQRQVQPVVLFVGAELQQPFMAFFSANPLPGVFLSFDDAQKVQRALSLHASVSADDQAHLFDYYCN